MSKSISVTYKNTFTKETYKLGMFCANNIHPNEKAWGSGFRTALQMTGWNDGDMIVSKVK